MKKCWIKNWEWGQSKVISVTFYSCLFILSFLIISKSMRTVITSSRNMPLTPYHILKCICTNVSETNNNNTHLLSVVKHFSNHFESINIFLLNNSSEIILLAFRVKWVCVCMCFIQIYYIRNQKYLHILSINAMYDVY